MTTVASAVRAGRRWLAALLLVLAAATPTAAHEIGTTRVSVAIEPDGRYRAEIVTDAASLVEKLEASSGRSADADATPKDMEGRLSVLDAIFRRRVSLAFDRA